jgi:hypothetical protein
MNVSAYEIAIIGGAFTVLGALIGAIVGYWFSRKLAQKLAYTVACSKLRASFAPALGQIYLAQKHGNHDRPCIDTFVKDNLLYHATAIEEFRPHVSSKNSRAYQNAWEDYCKIASNSIESAVEDRMQELEPSGAIKKNINKILSFAI